MSPARLYMLAQLDSSHIKDNYLANPRSQTVKLERQDTQTPEAITNTPKEENPLWEKAQSIAEWVCSRESTYRSALDLVGWEFPSMLAAATRNIYSFAETTFMAVIAFSMAAGAPSITKVVAKVLGKSILKDDEQKNLDQLLLFELKDLDNQESVQKAISRIQTEEPEDCSFLADLFKKNPTTVEKYETKAQKISEFFDGLEIDDEKRERLKKLKKAVIVGESAIEGPVWGALYYVTRLFRKYVLKQDRFTGTKGYESDEDAKKTGDDSKLNLIQKLGVAIAMASAPVMNWFLLKKVDESQEIKKGGWLETIKNNWDMTHGVFPKLGLLFSYIQVPATIGQFAAAQGKNELFENIMRQFTMVPSWWFGHHLTNGNLAKMADAKLAKKFNIDGGILVEKDELHKIAPEPARIQHVLKTVKDNPALEKEARKEHAKALYAGFGLHAGLVFAARMFMNLVTKFRVLKQLDSKKQA